MISIIDDIDIDKNKLIFISMESFEEVICNSEFILSKFPEMRDKVINYQDYIDASYKHAGKYFSDLLFKYVKVKSPLKKDGQRNATKFYEKGMNNFVECFLSDCCSFNIENCKLYLSENKRDKLLNNKFEILNGFRQK